MKLNILCSNACSDNLNVFFSLLFYNVVHTSDHLLICFIMANKKLNSKNIKMLTQESKEEDLGHKLLSSEFGPKSTWSWSIYRAAIDCDSSDGEQVSDSEFDIEAIDCDSSDGEQVSDSELDKIMAKIRRENICHCDKNCYVQVEAMKNVKPRVRFIGGKLEKLPSDSDDSNYSDLPPLQDYEEDDCKIPPLLDDIDIHALLVESVEEKTEILEDPAAAAPLFPHTVGETTFRPEDIFKHPAYKYIKAHIDYKKKTEAH